MKINRTLFPILFIAILLSILISCKNNDPNPTPSDTVTDIDGNVYKTIQIGIQTWMVENLKTTKYNDGTLIPLTIDNTAWKNLTTPSYCWYKNDESTYKDSYGALYNWYSVKSDKLCPTGWHVPSDNEWTILTSYLGGEAIAGGKLKETGTTHWKSPNTGATNDIGFTALPGGMRWESGTFSSVGFNGNWWSSTDTNIPGVTFVKDWAWYRTMRNDGIGADRESIYPTKRTGYSVRCIKD